jgi:hypothetical protein
MAGTAYGRRDRPTGGAAHDPRPRAADADTDDRLHQIESLRGFPSDGDDIGDAAAGGLFLPSFFIDHG